MTNSTLILLLSLGTLLWTSRVLGLLAVKLGHPSILGEISAGILLGPTVLGRISPEVFHQLFPTSGPVSAFYSGFNILAVLLLLFSAGTEMKLTAIYRDQASALLVSGFGVLVPFLLGALAAEFFPGLFGYEGSTSPVVFTLFMATAMSISALPVIVKTLRDLGLLDTRVGQVVISAAVLDDLAGWVIFSAVLALASHRNLSWDKSWDKSWGEFSEAGLRPLLLTLVLALAFGAGMLTIGSAIFRRILHWIKSWSRKILSYCIGIALFSAALTDWIGVHFPFGAFIAGAALGNTEHFDEDTRTTVNDFVNSFFAPIFFATLGLQADFISDFHWGLVLSIFVIACLGKILGCGVAARISGMNTRESLNVGLAMNSRGAMELLLGSLALSNGIIGRPVFVALAVMALGTSIMAGTLIRKNENS